MLSETQTTREDQGSNYLDDPLHNEKEYWLQKLSGKLQATGLPLDRPRFNAWSGRTGVVHFVIEREIANRLRQVCDDNDSLMFSVMITALKACLYLYNGIEDVCIGTAIHKRYADLTSLNKVLILRSRITGGMTIRQLLLDIKRTLSEAYINQKYPFDKLLQLLHVETPANRCPLFNIVVLFDRLNHRENCDHLKNDMTLLFAWQDEQLSCDIEYLPALFDRTNIEAFSQQYRVVLGALLQEADAQIDQIELVTQEEREEIIVAFNQTWYAHPQQATIHQLFENQVRCTPSAIAVVHGKDKLTYQQLNDKANQLAQYLRRIGFKPGERAGICLHHSTNMLIAVLAVLKAGCAYIPFDPAHPANGITSMLEDARPMLFLTESSIADKVSLSEIQIISLDTEASVIDDERAEDLPCEVTDNNLAYIIYTSGSTGEPKGVMIRHSSLVNYICWASKVYLNGYSMDFALYTSLAFDLTVTSIFTPLLTGNCVRIYSQQNQLMSLIEIMSDDQVGALKLTPSHLSTIKERDNRQSRVQTLIVGGEALESSLVRQIEESFGRKVKIFNEYGPTEATVGCMIYQYDSEKDLREFIPIGKPAANVQIYILDHSLRPAAEYMIGELCISGAGLAQGYLNKEKLTNETFVDHPFLPGHKLYKTGDLARRLPGNIIEYVGRKDEQLKYHGHRVELNHIRSLLNRHTQIRDSVIVVTKDHNGYDVMLAYYVSRHELEADNLRRFLAEFIVEEIIPSIFIHLKRLPLTLNGKVNIHALPTLEQVKKNIKRGFVEPQTNIEQQLAMIWAQVLKLDRIGIHDNFFELGGHSLLATQLVSRINSCLQIEFPLRCLFDSPTIAGQAEAVERIQLDGRKTQVPTLVRVSRERALPLSFAQQRLWFLDQLQPGNHFYNIPAVMRLSGKLNVDALERTISELISRHEVLRTNFPIVDGMAVQRINPAGHFRIPVIDFRSYKEAEQQIETIRIIEEESRHAFDLKSEVLLRVLILRLTDEEQVVFFMLHHIAGDALSTEIMIREVSALYQAFLRDEPSPLPDLPIQYADFAVWQKEWFSGDVLKQEIDYWKHELKGVPHILELPLDHPRPPVQKFEGASIPYQIDNQLDDKLRELSLREGSTLFMTMLAAFATLIYRNTNQQDILIGAPISGRNMLETENLIGFFTNTLSLRTRIEPEYTFLDLLRQVREVTLRAYAHQDFPFEKLVEELNPERSLSHTPLLQVIFGFYSNEGQTLELPGVKLRPINTKSKTAKFDLIHNVMETSRKITGSILFNTDLFEPGTIERLINQYKVLLNGIVDNPTQRLEQLPLITATEKQQLLLEWNDTYKQYPLQECVHRVFERQAAQMPDAIAIVSIDEFLNYVELNRRANRLAHYLQSIGVRAEIPVCILLDRSIDFVVSALAVLKSGGTFVSLDPATQLQRLSYYLDDSQAPLLITKERIAGTLPAFWGQTILLDEDQDKLDSCSSENLPNQTCHDNAAYVVYTSGSTGQPKGVQIQHSSLLNLSYWHINAYNVGPTDRATLVASTAFDASIWELWPYLVVGASVYIMPEDVKLNIPHLIEWLEKYAISLTFLPTPLAEIVIDQKWPPDIPLRLLLTGGGRLHCRPRGALPFDLINNYGPSENTVVSTWTPVSELGNMVAPPIGKPIDNTEAHVFDARFQPVQTGVTGEIYLSGSGLARGYLGRPDLTSEKFIPHPFSKAPGMRIYSTGDLARRLFDGNLEFLGRFDQQVKLRGFRIELGEIETILVQHPSINQCAVIMHQGGLHERQLVAYVTLTLEAGCTATSLRDYAKRRLPDYMIPSYFIILPALPLSSNGKLDREGLPAPETDNVIETSPVESRPMTWLETQLAALWCKELGTKNLYPQDNFFESGGDSIKAAIITNRLQQQLQCIIHVITIFDAPNIEQYASYLEENYPKAVNAWNEKTAESQKAMVGDDFMTSKISTEDVMKLRQLVNAQKWRRTTSKAQRKNPLALFILSSPRSGSTLLRVMLGGHNRMFAPPELELLGFDDLHHRREALSGKHSFWRQGTIRALMQLRGCEMQVAEQELTQYENEGMSTGEFYGLLQEALNGQLLVDKTPSYAMDLQTLQMAEEEFDGARYLHLVRNPYAMIHSYEEAHLDQIFPRFKHGFSCRAVAELVWLISQKNILDFLESIPAERQHYLKFEELVANPDNTMMQVCQWLGVNYQQEMLEPYKEKKRRMTDGLHEIGKMLGDIKFHEHQVIETDVVEKWRETYVEKFVSDQTWELAEQSGYKRERWDVCSISNSNSKNRTDNEVIDIATFSPIRPIVGNGDSEKIKAEVSQLSDDEVKEMLANLLNARNS